MGMRDHAGEDKHDYYHTCHYANCKKTVWGHIMKTSVLKDAGEHAIFGSPQAPDEGVLSLSLHPEERQIIVRVMDYEWGTRDVVLGEALLDINQYIDRGVQEVVLAKGGATKNGLLTFTMTWETQPNFLVNTSGCKCVRLTILRATNLPRGQWIGKNDVYVQAYALGPAVDGVAGAELGHSGTALPEPLQTVSLPAGTYSMPFSFHLPADLPSCFIGRDCRITYSVYSNIDIAWRADPSARTFFSVVQPHAVATMLQPSSSSTSVDIYPQLCCFPCCLWVSCPLICLGSYGNMQVTTTTDRYAYVAGDQIRCALDLQSTWAEASSKVELVTLTLRMVVTKFAEGHTETYRQTIGAPVTAISDPSKLGKISGNVPVPVLPPTYNGGLAHNKQWADSLSRWGNRWTRVVSDAVIWRYEIETRVRMNVPGLACNKKEYIALTPVFIAAIGLSTLPEVERYPAPVAVPVQMQMDHLPGQGVTVPLVGGDSNAIPVAADWRAYPSVVNVLHQVNQQYRPQPYGAPVVIKNAEEDDNTNQGSLSYTPMYWSKN
jgi:hypothetical protein